VLSVTLCLKKRRAYLHLPRVQDKKSAPEQMMAEHVSSERAQGVITLLVIDDSTHIVPKLKSFLPKYWRILQFSPRQQTAALHVVRNHIVWHVVCPANYFLIQSVSQFARVCVWSQTPRFDNLIRDKCIEAGAWHVELESLENLAEYLVVEMQGAVEMILYLQPSENSVLFQQLSEYASKSINLCGFTEAHRYPMHCSMTGFFTCSRLYVEPLANAIEKLLSGQQQDILEKRRPIVSQPCFHGEYLILPLSAPWCSNMIKQLVTQSRGEIVAATMSLIQHMNAQAPLLMPIPSKYTLDGPACPPCIELSTRKGCHEWSMGVSVDAVKGTGSGTGAYNEDMIRNVNIRPKQVNHISLICDIKNDEQKHSLQQLAHELIDMESAALTGWDIVLYERLLTGRRDRVPHKFIEHRRWNLLPDRTHTEEVIRRHFSQTSSQISASVNETAASNEPT